MRLIKLLEGLYQELRTFNEKYPEYLSAVIHENKMIQARFDSSAEKFLFQVDKQIEGLKWELKAYNEVGKERTETPICCNPGGTHEPLTDKERIWIKSRLSLKALRGRDVAQMSGCSEGVISSTLRGFPTVRGEEALVKALGYGSFDQLKADAAAGGEDITVAEKKDANADREVYAWIKSRFVLKNIRFSVVAKRANVNSATLTNFFYGNIQNSRIKPVIAEALGYSTWEALWADAVAGAKGGEV